MVFLQLSTYNLLLLEYDQAGVWTDLLISIWPSEC